MTIIPAIDIIEGKCVRLVQGDYSKQTIYNHDPLEVALQFEGSGLQRLHLVDLDGAKEGDVQNWKVLEKIATKTSLLIDFSGGISSQKNVEITFNSGAHYAAIGSMAVKNELMVAGWILAFGADRFIIGADIKNGKIATKGWTETSTISVFDLIEKYKTKGVKQFFCTDINKDGLLEGPALDLYKQVLNQHPSIDLIASGGVSSLNDLEDLRQAGLHGAIVGKAIYENRIPIKELKRFL
jgi:phosphoribosylformimino-5-aminoimidazole carboxamide ribotide isomerase